MNDPFEAAIEAASFEMSKLDEDDDYAWEDDESFALPETEPLYDAETASWITRDDDERRYNELVLEREARERDARRPPGQEADPPVDRAVAKPSVREPRQPPALVTVIGADGATSTIALGGNVDAVRAFIAERVDPDGRFTFERLIEPTPAGRLTEDERARRDELARLVAEARGADATLEAVTAATGRPLSTVHALEERGRALLGLAG